ncbi:MAG: DUF2442 domain-containing protein [Kiritimatiellales bacterium]
MPTEFTTSEPGAERVLFDKNDMTVELKDGRKLSVPLTYFPRLLHVAMDDLINYTLSGGGIGIHWDNLDEDISVEGLLMGIGDRTTRQHLVVA